ncbi:uncharacterized protein LOC129317675 [Prosopis cineraria]|uniref:uncharacterized protein LOC129317675 n=1 Tax=Prosopis cineraria TaxID=364024 RepID=UPI00240FDF5A|nr:uncharacterized protein LOC129317675 [Prosopis cineraria]
MDPVFPFIVITQPIHLELSLRHFVVEEMLSVSFSLPLRFASTAPNSSSSFFVGITCDCNKEVRDQSFLPPQATNSIKEEGEEHGEEQGREKFCFLHIVVMKEGKEEADSNLQQQLQDARPCMSSPATSSSHK